MTKDKKEKRILPKIVIMRGLPGSGKSTKVKELIEAAKKDKKSVVVCSADDHHIDKETGEYRYVKSRAGQAHQSCFYKAHSAVYEKTDIVIIDNTNISISEMNVYFDLHKMGYTVEIVDMHEDLFKKKGVKFTKSLLDELTKRNVHKVPEETIKKMSSNYFWYDIELHPKMGTPYKIVRR
ncbi:AAA family ATPase [Candidatus Peregrinibacteria bacterium]|nr:AAA family ATPase [Candidatus Peregrinibacteria bacterium]